MATRIYVGNLPYSADDQQLVQLFSAFGDVVEATVVIDRDTGQSKGFGFVQMGTDEAARQAIASLNGTMLGNRTIRVNEAQPRPERSGGSRSSGGYGRDRYDDRPHRNDYGSSRNYSGRTSYDFGSESGNRGYNARSNWREHERSRRERDW